MARSHGRILTSIWANESDFLTLSGEAQRLYMFILSQDDLNFAGLLPLRLRRWAKKYKGGSVSSVRKALSELAAARYVIVDTMTEEVLVRTFIRNDGIYKQPKVMLRMREDARQMDSPAIRRVFVAELQRLPLRELSDDPGGKNGDQPSTRETVGAVVESLIQEFSEPDTLSDTLPDTLSDTPSEGFPIPPRAGAGAFPLPPSPNPLTTSGSPHHSSSLSNARGGDVE